MDWTLVAMIVGIGVSGAAFALFFFVSFGLRPRTAGPKAHPTTTERSDGLRELCSALLFGGIALFEVGNIANQMRLDAVSHSLALTLAGSGFFVWACGFYFGRFSLRLQLRREHEAASRAEPS